MFVVALVVASVAVFAAHFRPWEVGFLEEWPLARDFAGGGGAAFAANYFEWTLSRPLHLIPTMIGLALGGGAPGAIFLVLAVVATAQLLAVVWALRPIVGSRWIGLAVGVFYALHPLWPGGFLQRFLPAQTAALGLALAIGFVIRWLLRGRAGWLIWGCVVLLIGLATYPGPAVAAPMAALALALAVDTTWRRRAAAVVAVTATSAMMTLYSLVVARLISPDGTSYEIGNIEVAAVTSPQELILYVGTTLLNYGQLVIVGIALVAALGAVLALTGAVPHWAGWLITGVALVSPATTIVFFGHTGWLSDIDRLGYVISMALSAALILWPLTRTGSRPRLEAVIAGLLVLASLSGAVRGIQHWQPYIAIQHQLLDALGPVVREAGPDEVVSVVDRSATLGQNGTFPLQYLGPASVVWHDDSTPVWLCFEPPAVLPSGAVVCDPEDTGTDLRLATTVTLPAGNVDIYIGTKDTNG